MLFDRQRRLLALVDALGGTIGSLDFQKLLFLYCFETESNPSYEFVPYKFGGFSFTSYADKRKMIECGFLADEERVWRLTPGGRTASAVQPSTRLHMEQFAKRHSLLRGDDLVAEVYRRHPYYAIRSEIIDQVLANDAIALLAVAAARPTASKPGLCTIGYEGRTLENYVNQLIQDGVTVLCDVRRNPLSRKYGFSKGTLSKVCQGMSIRYEHLPELGISSEDRRELKTQADYDALFAVYERERLPKQGEALAQINAWVAGGARVALTCFERLPHQCHRHCVAEALERTSHGKLTVVHL